MGAALKGSSSDADRPLPGGYEELHYALMLNHVSIFLSSALQWLSLSAAEQGKHCWSTL